MRFDDYLVEGLPYLDGVDAIPIVDPMTARLSFVAGEAHVLYNPDDTVAVALINEGYRSIVRNSNIECFYSGTKDPTSIMADKRVRLAMEYAVDKKEISETVGLNLVTPVYQLVPDFHPGYNPDLPPRTYGPDKAKELLKEAGYPNGFTVTAYLN